MPDFKAKNSISAGLRSRYRCGAYGTPQDVLTEFNVPTSKGMKKGWEMDCDREGEGRELVGTLQGLVHTPCLKS